MESKTKLIGLDVLGVSFIASGLSLISTDVVAGLGCAVVGVVCVVIKQNIHLNGGVDS